MARAIGSVLAFLAGSAAAGPAAAQNIPSTAITNVSIVDVARGVTVADQTVVVEGGRITRVGPSGSVRPPAGARVVPGRGRWLIPGLWDMHVHLSVPTGEPLLGVYLANGVTGVRDMNDSFPEVRSWRDRIARGDLPGPRIVASGPYLIGATPPLPHFRVTSAAEGRAGVDTLKALGVDFVKVHNAIPRDGYLAIAERVRELGWVFAGHVPMSVTVAEAADAGQRSMEHFARFSSRCTAADSAALLPNGLVNFLLGPCTQEDPGPTIARLIANRTWVTPTLVIQRVFFRDTAATDSTDRYRSDGLRRLQEVVMRLPPMAPEAVAAAKFLFRKRQELTLRLAQAGVPILAGSDAPGIGAFPGFSLHDELGLLVESGLTPAAALRAATLEPARYFAADSMGTIGVGKVADLVLLTADPLVDIANVRRIEAVWSAGRLFDRTARKELLAAAEAAAR